jgi:membrane protein YdbS with pleckstrin-like domain
MQRQKSAEAQKQEPILTVRPDVRKLWPIYAVLCVLIVLGVKIIYSSLNYSVTWLVVSGLVSGGGILFLLMFLWVEKRKLRSTIYTVTREYVAVDLIAELQGIRSYRIPTDQIQSVTPNTKADPIQWLLKLGSIIVESKGGDSIILDFIPNPAHAMAIIRTVAEQAKDNRG